MLNENTYKNEHGVNGIMSLEQMINTLKAKDYILNVQKRYRIADPDYEDQQFYFQYLIEFQDHEQWILHHTTSIRDRITEQQWHSEHIKRINQHVKKAYVVVPDGLDMKEKTNADKYHAKITEKKIYSALDGVIPFEKAYRMIEHKATGLMESGKAHAKLGLHFEEKLVDALNNRQNLEKWKNTTMTAVGYLYSLFVDVMDKLYCNPQEINNIKATSEIPKLPSGGMPKTDVLIEVDTYNGMKSYSLSCKRSSADRVSVHEYTADAFADVLNPNDMELRSLLVEFQRAGGIKAMGIDKSVALEQRLGAYKEKLSKWVLGGIGGEGDPVTQWASHIITVNETNNVYRIATIDEYIQEYDKLGITGQFGTPFQWTYPSGGKGKRIQLKGKMI
ncbi:MAG: MspI family type II restriction endonuclease [Clostridium sp.]|nr:MspI family type II restriction endonuclease [Clostridium sp.]MCM1460610.1 MspI family type II restriction endonuclease [Bacteroides sp.]